MQTPLSCFPPHRRLCLSCAACSRPLQQHSMAALRISSRNRSIASQRLYTRSALLSLSLPLVSPPWPVPVSSRLLSAFCQAAFVSCLAPPSLRRCLSLFLLLVHACASYASCRCGCAAAFPAELVSVAPHAAGPCSNTAWLPCGSPHANAAQLLPAASSARTCLVVHTKP